jgi:hypothetical protein
MLSTHPLSIPRAIDPAGETLNRCGAGFDVSRLAAWGAAQPCVNLVDRRESERACGAAEMLVKDGAGGGGVATGNRVQEGVVLIDHGLARAGRSANARERPPSWRSRRVE